ncbi:MAG TPA: hypothetical protein VF771_18005 [Longimicrobiaceae bacterium]
MHTRTLILAAAAAALALPRAAAAQVTHDTLRVEYAVKVLCGRTANLNNVQPPVATGQYWTSVNVHNPRAKGLVFRWKLAVTGPNVQQGPIVGFFPAEIGPDGAVRIDCARIGMIQLPAGFNNPIDAFVVLQSPFDVDVVAVYTAGAPTATGVVVSTMDVERVTPRRTLILPGSNLPVDASVGTVP